MLHPRCGELVLRWRKIVQALYPEHLMSEGRPVGVNRRELLYASYQNILYEFEGQQIVIRVEILGDYCFRASYSPL